MSLNLNALSIQGGGSGGGGGTQVPPTVANFAALPVTGPFDGALYETLDNNDLYAWNAGLGQWIKVGGSGVALSAINTASIDTSIIAGVISSVLNISTTAAPVNTQGISNIIIAAGSTGLQSYFPTGALTENTSSVLQFLGTGQMVGSTFGIQVNQASGTTSGYLSFADWNTFNNKQPFINVVSGDMLYGSTTNVLTNLPIGTTNQILTVTNGLPAWQTPFAAPASVTLFVDVNRTDSYTPDGTIGKPFLTITAAINQVIANGDNSFTKPYTILVAPGTYTENITLESLNLWLVSISSLNGSYGFGSLSSDVVTLNGDVVSTASNDNLYAFQLKGFNVAGSVNFVGATNGTNFLNFSGSFIDCLFTPIVDAAITLTNLGQVSFYSCAAFVSSGNGDVVYTNVNEVIHVLGNFNMTQPAVITNGGNQPAGFGGSLLLVTQCNWASGLSLDAGSVAIFRYNRNGTSSGQAFDINGSLTSTQGSWEATATINTGGSVVSRGDTVVTPLILNGGTLTHDDHDLSGFLDVGTANPSNVHVNVGVSDPANLGQIIQLAAAQTADALEVQDSSTAVLAKIDASGNVLGATLESSSFGGGKMLTSVGLVVTEANADSSMASNKITSVKDPTNPQDAATKNYVDTVASSLNPLQAVYAGSTTNIVGTYLNGVGGVGAIFTVTATAPFTIDGTTPPQGSRILLKDQTSGFQNGVYDLTNDGTGPVSPVLTRSADYNTATSMNAGDLIPVINGTANAITSWLQTATITTVGVDPLVFVEWTANPAAYLLKANNLSDVSSPSASFDNISPMTTGGDIIYGGASGTGTRLPNGSSNQVLTSTGGTSAPTWATAPFSTVEYVSNSGMGDNDDITNFVTSTNGSPIPSVTYTANRAKRIQFATAITATSRIELQVKPNDALNSWFTLCGVFVDTGSNQNISQFVQSSGTGMSLFNSIGTNQVDVLFAQFQDNSGTNWSTSNTARWRVIKIS